MLEQPLNAKSKERKLLLCFDDGSRKLILKQMRFFFFIQLGQFLQV